MLYICYKSVCPWLVLPIEAMKLLRRSQRPLRYRQPHGQKKPLSQNKLHKEQICINKY